MVSGLHPQMRKSLPIPRKLDNFPRDSKESKFQSISDMYVGDGTRPDDLDAAQYLAYSPVCLLHDEFSQTHSAKILSLFCHPFAVLSFPSGTGVGSIALSSPFLVCFAGPRLCPGSCRHQLTGSHRDGWLRKPAHDGQSLAVEFLDHLHNVRILPRRLKVRMVNR
jgi:hypothetical protein